MDSAGVLDYYLHLYRSGKEVLTATLLTYLDGVGGLYS